MEKKIPVFTVIKNGSILKNIFLIDNPPSISGDSVGNVGPSNQEWQETLLVGRHPDCNITLEHPSISRFHLRLHSQPSSQRLSVIDFSVHGTWVSGKKIEPGAVVELNEGDTMRLGASARVYRLHWVPLSCAYDLENPFVPSLDVSMTMGESKEEKHQNDNSSSVPKIQDLILTSSNEISESFMKKDENCCSAETAQIQILGNTLEDPTSLCSFEKLRSSVKKDKNCFSAEKTQTLDVDLVEGTLSLSDENLKSPLLKRISPSAPPLPEDENSSFSDEEVENQQDQSKDLLFQTFVAIATEVSQEENTESPPVMSERKSNPQSIWSRRGKLASVQIRTSKSMGKNKRVSMDAEFELLDQENVEIESVSKVLFDGADEKEIFTPDKENRRSISIDAEVVAPLDQENIEGESIREILFASVGRYGEEDIFIPDKENFKPSSVQSRASKSRGEVKSHNQDKKNSDGEEEIITPDPKFFTPRKPASVDAKVGFLNQDKAINEYVLKPLFSSIDVDHEEIYTPDKENLTPNTLLLSSIKRMGKLEKSKHSKLSSSLKNQARLEPELNALKRSRTPLKSLLVNSASKSKSRALALDSGSPVYYTETTDEITQSYSKNNTNEVDHKRWVMVVDTNCLLNKGSRKALQLLQGLKGTQLIIPRIVVRELDSMNQRVSLFQRTTDASSALQWIAECMTNSKGWIHVQSSMEEGRAIAPTPPVSPLSGFNEDTGRFPFGSLSFSEIVSPTAKDHILECALLFRSRGYGQLVLLSDDIGLKINAMAEGLICERPEEFRESVVNPFSERFMWAGSSARGPTWSCADDTVLREKSRDGGGARGLKLILLHNSHYRQISSSSVF